MFPHRYLDRLSVKIARVWDFAHDCQDLSTVRKLAGKFSMILLKVIFETVDSCRLQHIFKAYEFPNSDPCTTCARHGRPSP